MFKKGMIAQIAAVQTSDRGIGYQNDLLHKIKTDMKFFSKQTKGNIVVMGRNTFESIGKPLPGRINVVLTSRDLGVESPNLFTFSKCEKALRWCLNTYPEKIVFVCGGQRVKGKAARIWSTVSTI